jgi:hypothetical protein
MKTIAKQAMRSPIKISLMTIQTSLTTPGTSLIVMIRETLKAPPRSRQAAAMLQIADIIVTRTEIGL